MKRRDAVIYGSAIVASLVIHVALFEGLGAAAMNRPPPRQRTLEFAVIETPPPPPPEPEKPPEPKPEPPKPKPKPVDLSKVVPPPETPPPPTPTNEPPAEKPRPVFGVSMSSTVGPGNSGFSVRVGNTLMKEPEKEYTPPAEVKAYKPVPLYQVSKAPSPLSDCQPDKKLAQRQRYEGRVRLRVEIKDDGEVGSVEVLKGLDQPGANELAMDTLRRCKFAPAEQGGTKVATVIEYTYTFVLEE